RQATTPWSAGRPAAEHECESTVARKADRIAVHVTELPGRDVDANPDVPSVRGGDLTEKRPVAASPRDRKVAPDAVAAGMSWPPENALEIGSVGTDAPDAARPCERDPVRSPDRTPIVGPLGQAVCA